MKMADGATFSFYGILQLAAATGVATTAANYLFDVLKERRKDKAEAAKGPRFYASQMVPSLEEYAIYCVDEITAILNYRSSHGNIGRPAGDVPSPSHLPYYEWRGLDPELLTRYLSLFVQVKAKNQDLRFLDEIPGGEDEKQQKALKMIREAGAYAVRLAVDLRKKYELGKSHLNERTKEVLGVE
jgi:hypothetical protein